MKLFEYLKNIFLILIVLQFVPTLLDGIKKQYSQYLEQKTSVGLVKINKTIYDSASYIKQFTSLFKNNEIKAIAIKMDCPGGAAGSANAIFLELQELKKQYPKPVVVLVENVCASGGYWIACAADHIIAPGTALVGSIGATFPYVFQLRSFLSRYDVHTVNLKAGQYKTATDPLTDITPQEQEMLQNILNNSYEQFTQSVAIARKLTTSASTWADGKVFTAQQALALGLIDQIGSTNTLISVLKDRTLIEGEIQWVSQEPPKTLWGSIFSQKDDDDGSFMSSTLSHICSFFENRYATTKLQ